MTEKVADIQASATVDWSPLGDIFIKKHLNYTLDWKVNLAENLVAIGPYGGLVAIVPKGIPKSGVRRCFDIYSLSGNLITSIPFEGGKVVGLGWTSSDNLVAIGEDGYMTVYDVHGVLKYNRIITREVKDHRVCECKFFHTLEGSAGFAVMSNKYQFFVVGDSDRPKDEIRVKKLADLPPTATTKPSCWEVLPQGNQVSIAVAVENKLYLLDPFDSMPQNVVCKKELPYWIKIAISPTGKAVALVDREGYMWGGSTDFKVCETEFDLQTGSGLKIHQMEWGGKDFFVIVMQKLMFVKGTGKHWCKFPFHEPCVLIPEIDGVRILRNSCCEFMHRVASSSLSVLRIGSMEPGALLNDAYKEFEGDESHKADEYIRYIKDKLPDAVSQCIKAAGEEFSPDIQQSLLKSANFGKGFLGPDVPTDVVNQFVEMCHQLRVLNNVRAALIGIPITLKQYYRLSTGVLIDRLINRGLYQMAFEICKYLKIPPVQGEVKILRQWAMRKVMDKSVTEERVGEIIINRIATASAVVSYAEIARVARENNRLRLAALLLDYEVHAKDQVPLLMEMRKADLALDKAIESGDPQLVYGVLEELRNKQYQSQMDRYLQLFHHRPVAAALFKKLCKEIDQEQLLNLHRQESDFIEAGCLLFAQSFRKKDEIERNRCLHSAKKEFHEGQHLFHQKVVEEQEKLLKEQADIERKYSFNVKGLTLFDTILECVKNRQPKLAEHLRREFKISDNQFWWAKIRGLAHIGDYEEMERFSKQKKSPIGYEPFAELCRKHRNRRDAVKYVQRAAPENRFNLYMSMDEYSKAAETAFQNKNLEQLNDVQNKASRIHEVMEQVRAYQARLAK